MAIDATKAFQHETDFLAGVEANLETAKGTLLRGSTWQLTRDDETDRLRALMARHRNYDREKLKSLPANRRIVLRGFERRWLLGRKPTGVAIASVLSPMGHFSADGEAPAPPVGLGELTDHVHKLVSDRKSPYVIGICSPTGFTKEARTAQLTRKNLSIVLIEPNEAGGWQAMAVGDSVDPALMKLFDPESATMKEQRVRKLLESHRAELLTGGLSASAIAGEANLPEHIVRQGFDQLAAVDPELHVTRNDGECLLYQGAAMAHQERKSMNVIDRIRQLFSGDGDEAEKVNLLAERRATLTQRRDKIYEAIGQLEKKESDLLVQGKAATSSVPKRRIAAQLAQLRKDIGRQNTSAAMLNQQINIISTDIHNLTLIQQGERAQLPDTTELTEHAVQAEEMLESLKADADMVGSLETGIEATLTSDEELAIMQEFEEEQPSKLTDTMKAPTKEAELPTAETPPSRGPIADALPPAAPEQSKQSPDPETT